MKKQRKPRTHKVQKTALQILAELEHRLYIRPAELATLLSVPRQRAYRLAKLLPVVQMGPKTILLPVEAVRVFVEASLKS